MRSNPRERGPIIIIWLGVTCNTSHHACIAETLLSRQAHRSLYLPHAFLNLLRVIGRLEHREFQGLLCTSKLLRVHTEERGQDPSKERALVKLLEAFTLYRFLENMVLQ